MAALGPFGVGVLHEATGGWTVPLLVLTALSVPLFFVGLYVGKPAHLEDQLRRPRRRSARRRCGTLSRAPTTAAPEGNPMRLRRTLATATRRRTRATRRTPTAPHLRRPRRRRATPLTTPTRRRATATPIPAAPAPYGDPSALRAHPPPRRRTASSRPSPRCRRPRRLRPAGCSPVSRRTPRPATPPCRVPPSPARAWRSPPSSCRSSAAPASARWSPFPSRSSCSIRGKDGRNHGKGLAIAALIISVLSLVGVGDRRLLRSTTTPRTSRTSRPQDRRLHHRQGPHRRVRDRRHPDQVGGLLRQRTTARCCPRRADRRRGGQLRRDLARGHLHPVGDRGRQRRPARRPRAGS